PAPPRSRALSGRLRPGEQEARALAGAVALGAHPPARELHQAAHDEQPEAGTVVAAPAPGVQTRELLEEPRAVGRGEADAAVAHLELDLAVRGARRELDPAAGAGERGERVLEDVAHHDVERERIGDHVQLRRNAARDLDARAADALVEVREHARDG